MGGILMGFARVSSNLTAFIICLFAVVMPHHESQMVLPGYGRQLLGRLSLYTLC